MEAVNTALPQLRPSLFVAVVAALLLGTPGVAAAVGTPMTEGPGYDGRAHSLAVKHRKADRDNPGKGNAGKDTAGRGNAGKDKDDVGKRAEGDALVVTGRGFRGGSTVRLRIGDGAEATAIADAAGEIRLLLDPGQRPGATVVAVGQTPSGSAMTLVGSVPRDSETGGTPTAVVVIVAALGLLALAGGMVWRADRRGEIREPIFLPQLERPGGTSYPDARR